MTFVGIELLVCIESAEGAAQSEMPYDVKQIDIRRIFIYTR